MVSGEGSSQKGYTLIEMVVVIGIVVALAAVVVPLVIRFSGAGALAAEAAEWDAVQSAVDTMMTDNQLSTVSASTGSTRIADNLDWDASSATVSLAAYTRDTITNYCYEWAATGRIIAQYQLDTSTDPASCSNNITDDGSGPSPNGFQLRVSLENDRVPSEPLSGQTISGTVYVFLDDPELEADDVTFYQLG